MKQLYICLLAFVGLLSACDDISESERLIYEKPADACRVVLIEDFTGQRCNNCPKATEVIEQLQKEYGDSIVAVGIHGGPLGFKGNAATVGLATDIGDEYYNHWSIPFQPYGYINRSRMANYPDWATVVKEELSRQTPVTLSGSATIEGSSITTHVEVKSTSGTVSGKLQVWLIEDGITALQIMPDHLHAVIYVTQRMDTSIRSHDGEADVEDSISSH